VIWGVRSRFPIAAAKVQSKVSGSTIEGMIGMENVLYYGDNLDILRRYVGDESVDLIYLDPPFNSSQNYNVLFKEKDGTRAASQIQAFEDTWIWDQEDEAGHVDLGDGCCIEKL